jgi:peptidoglycan LD-endopeptidase CwlK
MASRKKEDLFDDVRIAWEKSEEDWRERYPNRAQPFLTATHRSNEEQAKLYAQGRTAPGKRVTNARPGQSNHNKYPSPAFDIAFKKADGALDWSEKLFSDFAVIAKSNGLAWGGDWRTPDTPHFERKGIS